MGRTIKLEAQKIYAITVVYMISFVGLLNLINSLLNMVGFQTVLDTAVLYGGMIALVLLSMIMFFRDNRRIPPDVLLVVGLFILLYAGSYLMFPDTREYLMTSVADYAGNPLYFVFLYSLPGYIVARKLTDYEFFRKVLLLFSYLIVGMSIVVFFLAGEEVHGKQYMTFSYNMLLQLFVLLYHKPKHNKLFHILFLVAGMFAFVFGGARGALVSFVIAVVIYNFQSMRMSRKTIFQLIGLLTLVLLYAVFQEQILYWIVDLLEQFGVESRTFEYFIQGIFLDDSHRMDIYTTSMEHIDLIGLGMRGDRVFLDGGYTHNLFLELWVDFGWVVGSLVILLLLAILFVGIKNKRKPEHFFVLMLLANGFLGLIVSGSYLNQAPALYVLIGLCVNSMIRREPKRLADEE